MPIQSQVNRGGVCTWFTPSDDDLIDMIMLARLSKKEGDIAAYQKIINVTMMAMTAKEHEKKTCKLLDSYGNN
jgi:hypothetical protein